MAVGQQLDISSTVSGGLPKPLPDDVCKTYDVTSKWDPYVLFCVGLSFGFPCLAFCAEKKTLTIETEEVVLNINNGCENKNKRLPYGELGSVHLFRVLEYGEGLYIASAAVMLMLTFWSKSF